MKRVFSLFFTLCLCLAMPFMLTSCNDHNYSTDWTYNEEYHWHACTDKDCTEVQDKASHNWTVESHTDTNVYYKCSVCPATKTETHQKATEWTKNETHHWKVCTADNCSYKYDEAEHDWDSGVKEGFETTYTCQICGHTKLEVEQHTHTTGEEWLKDKTNHWKVCTDSRCVNEKIDLDAHDWGTPVVEGNIQISTCSICGEEKEEEYVEGHTHSYLEWSTDEAYHWKECIGQDCNQEVERAQHDWDNGVNTETAITYTCQTCGKTKGHIHTYNNGEWQTNDNQHWKKCDEFGCEQKGLVANHDFDNGVESGNTIVYTCQTCEFKKVHTHTFSSTWEKNNEYHWQICTGKDNCTYTTEKEEHEWNKGIVSGKHKIYTCVVCSQTKSEDYVAPVQDYVLKLTDVVITNETVNYKFEVAELYLYVDETGVLQGHGAIKSLEPYTNLLFNEGYMILDGNDLYVTVESFEGDYTNNVINIKLDDLSVFVVNMLESRMDMTLADLTAYVSEYQEEIDAVLAKISEFLAENQEAIKSIETSIKETLFTSVVSETDITYTLNFEIYKALNQYLSETEIKNVFEDLFGEGSYAGLNTTLVDSLELTVADLMTMLEQKGIVIEDVLSYLDMVSNYIAEIMMSAPNKGGPIETSDSNIGKLTSSSMDITGGEMEEVVETVTFEQLLSMILGRELPFGDIGEMLNDPEMQSLKVIDIINIIIGDEEPISAADFKVVINGYFATYGESTVYEVIEEFAKVDMKSVKETIDFYVDMISDMIIISYRTDKQGVVLNAGIQFNAIGALEGKIEYIKDYVSSVDYETIKDEIVSKINAKKLTKDMLPETANHFVRTETTEAGITTITYTTEINLMQEEAKIIFITYEFMFDSEDQLIGLKRIEEQEDYAYTMDIDSEFEITRHTKNETILNFEPNSYSISILSKCGDSVMVSINLYNGLNNYLDEYYNDGLVTESYSSTFPVGNISFNFDNETNVISFQDIFEKDIEHNFKELVNNRVETPYGYILKFVCEECGKHYYETLYNVLDSRMGDSLSNFIDNMKDGSETLDNYYLVYGNSIVYSYNVIKMTWEINTDIDINDLEYSFDFYYDNYKIYKEKAVSNVA